MIDKLIINADDFGLCEGNTIGIILAHKNGLVSSSTCMMNMPYTKDYLKYCDDLKLGVHLNITIGKPLTHMTSFVDDKGYFRRPNTYSDNKPHGDNHELYQEFKAQIEYFITLTGHRPDHLDSHHHVHLLPWFIEITKQLAYEYDIPIRQRDMIIQHYEYVKCIDNMYDDLIHMDFIKEICNSNDGIIELMCHPGLIDQRLCNISSYNLARMKELALLTSDELNNYINEQGIEIITFSDLRKK
ncbi:MAG: carbohydrate deacetylase [Erysipelotrichaceae bacterium]|nr:carbohydrate deacetylase [Erysipelotrichaceae bacterium]